MGRAVNRPGAPKPKPSGEYMLSPADPPISMRTYDGGEVRVMTLPKWISAWTMLQEWMACRAELTSAFSLSACDLVCGAAWPPVPECCEWCEGIRELSKPAVACKGRVAFDLVYDRSCALSHLLSDWSSGRSTCCCIAWFRTYTWGWRMAWTPFETIDLLKLCLPSEAVPCRLSRVTAFYVESEQSIGRVLAKFEGEPSVNRIRLLRQRQSTSAARQRPSVHSASTMPSVRRCHEQILPGAVRVAETRLHRDVCHLFSSLT